MPPPELQQRGATRLERPRIQLLLNQNQFRPHQIGDEREMRFVKFDGDRTNDGANAPYAKPEKQLLDNFIGEQNDDIAALDATSRQISGDVRCDLVQLGEIDPRLLVQIDDGRFVRIAPAKAASDSATLRNGIASLWPPKGSDCRGINVPSSPAIRSSP